MIRFNMICGFKFLYCGFGKLLSSSNIILNITQYMNDILPDFLAAASCKNTQVCEIVVFIACALYHKYVITHRKLCQLHNYKNSRRYFLDIQLQQKNNCLELSRWQILINVIILSRFLEKRMLCVLDNKIVNGGVFCGRG